MRFVVIISSNDGGSGHVCDSREAVADLVRVELDAPDSNGEGLLDDEPERMERGISEFLRRTEHGIDTADLWWIYGRDRWREQVTIAVLREDD